MLHGHDLYNKVVLEPSAGKGDMVDYAITSGAKSVLACETNENLRAILKTKCTLIENDFLNLTSNKISHVEYIVMNPPFSNADKHILHAFSIAPEGCTILALCNWQTVKNQLTRTRQELGTIIENYGHAQNFGECFSNSERSTDVEVGFIELKKPGQNSNEFEGFYLEEDQEESTGQGIISYNVVRDVVNRYVEAVKLFDKQAELAIQMNNLCSGFFGRSKLSMQLTSEEAPITRNEFKKAMQKSGWLFIFEKLNMEKYSTRQLKSDINKFVETQTQIPFTMRNIYKMIEIVFATNSQRMDKALLEVFDKLTEHHFDNRYNVEGWKTNSHYLVNRRFIMPRIFESSWSGNVSVNIGSYNLETLSDFIKALCLLTGQNYDKHISLHAFIANKYKLVDQNGEYISSPDYYGVISSNREEELLRVSESYPGSKVIETPIEWGKWNDWGFFRFRPYKKGTGHFEFIDPNVWGLFNQNIARIKGYPLYEYKKETTKKQPAEKFTEAKVLHTIKLKVA